MDSCWDSSLRWHVLLNHVSFIALGAENLNSICFQLFAEADRDAFLVIAQSTRAVSECPLDVFGKHLGHSFWAPNVPIMDQPIDVDCVLDKLEVPLILETLIGGCLALVQMVNVELELLLS